MSGELIERLLQPLPEGMCGRSMGCNAASICLCSVIEDQRETLAEAAAVIARLMGAVERAQRHAMNIGITDGSYLAELDDALAFAAQRQSVSPRPRRNASPSEVKTGRQGIGEE